MRQWVKPRSLLLHLAFLVIAAGCGVAADWQVHRAIQGNTLSYLYAIEWPAFIVVAGIGWWQWVHDTPEDIEARRAYHTKMRAASAAVVARTLPRSARAITVGSHDVSSRALGPGSVGAHEFGPAGAAALGSGSSSSSPSSAGLLAARASVEVARIDDPEMEAVLLDAEDHQVDPNDDLAAYNQYLANLALHGKPKTWRNPRGLE